MLDHDGPTSSTDETALDRTATAAGSTTRTTSTRRRAAGRPAGPPAPVSADIFAAPAPVEGPATKTTKTAKKTTKRPARAAGPADEVAAPQDVTAPEVSSDVSTDDAPAAPKAPVKATRSRRRTASKKAGPPAADSGDGAADSGRVDSPAEAVQDESASTLADDQAVTAAPERVVAPAAAAMFQAPETTVLPSREVVDEVDADDEDDEDDAVGQPKRRRRSRGGRRRRKSDSAESTDEGADGDAQQGQDEDRSGSSDESADESESAGTSRRRRRRARAGEQAKSSEDDPDNTVVKVRQGRSAEDEITGVTGSTRLEAKKQRRREGREAGRRRAPIVSEAEFLARRESVDRKMVVREHTGPNAEDSYTQIAVLEDKMLVEHYVARESQTSLIGNVYLGKVQNVLPSMEAAFVDIGVARNAVIYAGEVDWSGVENGKARKIEDALSPGQTILVQVSKDPVGQKGARLTSQISLPGRFLVFVPGGNSNGISRKLPDTERARLKNLLKEVLPEDAGVIVRTAAEGATEDQLTRDVSALKARWDDISAKVDGGHGPQLLYSEPDVMIKVVRDLFNEDFAELVVDGANAWDNIEGYVSHVAPDLHDRVRRWEPRPGDPATGVFDSFRIDEQINKALERKVWLPSGGSLVIDRTEAMTVVDVNTGKFTGSGGNLEETVTKNNLEAAEEIVRQLRLRDIGGIIVIDFIDMVLESNRELVLRRLVECLGRDRTRHQVAEVTSLGLVQMTRKRIGTGLLESFSTDCDHCKGRGVVVTTEPVEAKSEPRTRGRRGGRSNNGNRRGKGGSDQGQNDQAQNDQGQSDHGHSDHAEAGPDGTAAEQDVSHDDAVHSEATHESVETTQHVTEHGSAGDQPAPENSADDAGAIVETPADQGQIEPDPTQSGSDDASGDEAVLTQDGPTP